MGPPTLAIVFPAFNEEGRLPRLLEILGSGQAEGAVEGAGLRLLEAVIVDDGSVDGTGDILCDDRSTPRLVRAVCLPPPNRGKGAALAAGVRTVNSDFTLLSDVDLSTPLGEVEKLYGALQHGADIAIGSRALLSSEVQGMPRHRHVMGLVFNRLIRAVTGLEFRDTQCGFKLFPTPVAKQLTHELLVSGFSFDVELLLRARAAGLRTEEVPVAWRHHPDSRVQAATAPFRMTWDVLRVAARLRGTRGG